MRKAAQGAARLMAAEGGPRIAALAFEGWDTHVAEGGATGRLATLLGGLDDAFGEFESASRPRLGARRWCWRSPNSAALRGSTATAAATTARRRRRSSPAARWPGAASSPTGRACEPANLYENRDLKPTTDLRAVLKGVLADHLGLSATTLAEVVFPQTHDVAPMKGLVAG